MVTATQPRRRQVRPTRSRSSGPPRTKTNGPPGLAKTAREQPDPSEDRVARLLETDIEFIPNEAFLTGDVDLDETDRSCTSESGMASPASPVPAEMPAHLARLCAAELLTPERERELFRRMNYLKYRANELRLELDPATANVAQLDQLEQHLIEARRIRDQIIEANMRLVISIVKRFVTPQFSFDDLLSEGTRTLMIAVEKFDYGRGFRFSTYAYRAISRNAYRAVADGQKESNRFKPSSDTLVGDTIEDDAPSSMDEKAREALRARLTQFVHRLDRRERFIIRGRYALGSHRRTRTFQNLADLLGLSKERVRQLEQRAIDKLKQMAAEMPGDELAEVA